MANRAPCAVCGRLISLTGTGRGLIRPHNWPPHGPCHGSRRPPSPFTVHTRVSTYTITAVPSDIPEIDAYDYELTVEYRGRGLWGVYLHKVWCLSSSGKWDREILPSSHTDAWLQRHRFEREDAIARAKQVACGIVVNGVTISQLVDQHRKQLGESQ